MDTVWKTTLDRRVVNGLVSLHGSRTTGGVVSVTKARLRLDIVLLLLMLPGLAYFLVFHYGALAGTAVAFENFRPYLGVWDSQWVGLRNFIQLFGDEMFWHAAWNTLYIAVLQL